MNRPNPIGGNGSDVLERGRFFDGRSRFTVRASSADSPDSFQVYANGNSADIVMIVSGLNTGHLIATWGDGWRTLNDDWKTWLKQRAFDVFYNGHGVRRRTGTGDTPGAERSCNG